jgi:plasmid maintenance system antidote protein VapI
MKRRLEQNHIPTVAMHPGELLRNEIKERGLKQTDLERLFDKIETRNKTEISLQNLNISSQKRESILGAMMA